MLANTVENTIPSHTNIATKIMTLIMPLAYMFQVLLAYLFRHLVQLQLVYYTPVVLGLGSVFFLKESTRWLIAKGRLEEAIANIQYINAINGRIQEEAELQSILKPKQLEDNGEAVANIKELFSPRPMLIRTVINFAQWFCVTATFYGLAVTYYDLLGSPYLNAIGKCPNQKK